MSTRSALFFAAAALLLGASAASAQARAFVAGGAIVPLGEFSSVGEPGPAVTSGVLLETGAGGLAVGVDVSYGRAAHSIGDTRSDVYGLMGLLAYTLRGLSSVEVMPVAGLGVLVHARRSSDSPGLDATRSGVGASLGLRAAVPVGRLSVFASGSYVLGFGHVNTAAFPLELLSLGAGVSIPFGG
jgi:hypothetical protein